MPKIKGSGRWVLPITAFFAGIFVILGSNAMISATDNYSFCASCHVMSEQVWTHQQSVHAKQTCVDCHTPHNIVGKLYEKATLGVNDVLVNTFGSSDDNIRASDGMKEIIKTNCVRCHYASIQEVNMDVKALCTDCHRSVPHMNKLPIDRRRAGDV